MVDKKIIKEYGNDTKVYDFDPAEEYQDGEGVNENLMVKRHKIGLTEETAERKQERSLANKMLESGYREYVPCVVCGQCITIREMEHGAFVNKMYACHVLRRLVNRHGTCKYATPSKIGPMVIVRDKTKEELEARKMELVN